MVDIELTSAQVLHGAMVGVMRQVDSVKRGFKAKALQPLDDQWGQHIEGALAEMAVAQCLDVFWPGDVRPNSRDLSNAEVKMTVRDDGSLVVKPGDDQDVFYWLATGRHGKYRVHGFIHGRDACVPAYWRKDVRSPAWFVPQSKLRNPEEWNGSSRRQETC